MSKLVDISNAPQKGANTVDNDFNASGEYLANSQHFGLITGIQIFITTFLGYLALSPRDCLHIESFVPLMIAGRTILYYYASLSCWLFFAIVIME